MFDQNKSQLEMYLTDISETNYFNPKHGIIRVRSPFKSDVYYDFKLSPTIYHPNPTLHKALIITSFSEISDVGLSQDRLRFQPGIKDESNSLAEIQMGIVYIIDKKQRIYTVDNQNASTAFSMSNTNMYDDESIVVSLTPTLSTSYTTNDNNSTNELGVFMNKDTINIRSRGAQITLADEGIHFGGNIHWNSTTHSKEFMQDNFLHQLVPATIVTIPTSMPQVPNFGMIANIASAANSFINILGKSMSIIERLK